MHQTNVYHGRVWVNLAVSGGGEQRIHICVIFEPKTTAPSPPHPNTPRSGLFSLITDQSQLKHKQRLRGNNPKIIY